MGGLFGGSTPAPAPVPARPVTAVAKTPDIELDDTELQSDVMMKKRRGKRALRQDITSGDTGVQIPKTASGSSAGVQVPK